MQIQREAGLNATQPSGQGGRAGALLARQESAALPEAGPSPYTTTSAPSAATDRGHSSNQPGLASQSPGGSVSHRPEPSDSSLLSA